MATSIRSRVSHDFPSTRENFQKLDQLSSDQMAMVEEALTMANAILKLAAMDASLAGYISAAENTPDLVQRLLFAQNSRTKESDLLIEAKQGSVEEVSIEEVTRRLKRSSADERRVFDTPQRKERLSSQPTSRTSSRSSSRESKATKTESRRSVECPVDIIRRTSTPSQIAAARPRTKSPQIDELPRLGEDLDRRSSHAKTAADAGHFSLRCWGSVLTGVASHWVKGSSSPVRHR